MWMRIILIEYLNPLFRQAIEFGREQYYVNVNSDNMIDDYQYDQFIKQLKRSDILTIDMFKWSVFKKANGWIFIQILLPGFPLEC